MEELNKFSKEIEEGKEMSEKELFYENLKIMTEYKKLKRSEGYRGYLILGQHTPIPLAFTITTEDKIKKLCDQLSNKYYKVNDYYSKYYYQTSIVLNNIKIGDIDTIYKELYRDILKSRIEFLERNIMSELKRMTEQKISSEIKLSEYDKDLGNYRSELFNLK